VENAKGKRLMEWIGEHGGEVLNGNKQGDEEGEWSYIDSRGNSERRSMGKSRRIQNRRESRVGSSRNSFKEAKGRKRTEKERGGNRNKTGYFYFFGTSLHKT
jgi:hypothetical protein